MTYWQILLGFSAASFAIAISPGPSWIYVISTTLQQDRKAGLVAVLGNGTGILCHVLAATFGLSALLKYSPTAYAVTKWLGVIYLVYLGMRMIWQNPTTASDTQPTQMLPYSTIFREGLLVNVLNPKVALLMLALLPQFVESTKGHVPLQTLCIGTLHVLIASIVLTSIVHIVGHSTRIFHPSQMTQKIFRCISGSILISLGILMAFATKP